METINHLFAFLGLLLHAHVGTATTFWSQGDPANPNPLNYCSNRPLRDQDLVVAHPTLPCRSKVLLYNIRTRLWAVATVMDRGPRHALIDISKGVEKLIKSNGYEKVIMMAIK